MDDLTTTTPATIHPPIDGHPTPARTAEPELLQRSAFPHLLTLFVLLAGGLAIGAIIQGKASYCPNDNSRWNTVYYLTEHGTYEYLRDHGAWWNRKNAKTPDEIPPFWTIDMVGFRQADGSYRYYSSKPPLLPTLFAGVVLVIEGVTRGVMAVLHAIPGFDRAFPGLADNHGADFKTHLWFITRTTLILTQVIPLMLFVWLAGRELRRLTDNPFVWVFCLAAAALGTYLTPWAITFNNHLFGAVSVMVALYAAVRIWYEGRTDAHWFALAGFFAGFMVTAEMPALSFATMVMLALLIRRPSRALLIALPLMLLPIGVQFLCNYIALGTWKPAYAEFGKPGGGYDYPGSYWNSPSGVDALAEPKPIYLMHLLLGHHGFFLLTPIFLLSLLGVGRHLREDRSVARALIGTLILLGLGVAVALAPRWLPGVADEFRNAIKEPDSPALDPLVWRPQDYAALWVVLAPLAIINLGMYLRLPRVHARPLLAVATLAASAAVIGFYTFKSNNYGGTVMGARWLFWLIPLWLLFLPAGVGPLATRRAGRCVCYLLLLISLMSVAYVFKSPDGPWTTSWAHLLFRELGWINY